jgi:hypothetical protein
MKSRLTLQCVESMHVSKDCHNVCIVCNAIIAIHAISVISIINEMIACNYCIECNPCSVCNGTARFKNCKQFF